MAKFFSKNNSAIIIFFLVKLLLGNFAYANNITSKTYIGIKNGQRNANTTKNFFFPDVIKLNEWAFSGKWNWQDNYAESIDENSAIRFHFKAKKVLVKMSSRDHDEIKLFLTYNGKKIEKNIGKNVVNSAVIINELKEYELLEFKDINEGIIEIKASKGQAQIYNFTFK